MIADPFRRHGYRVQEVGGRGRADGGVDVVHERDGETTIMQAKHRKRDRLGVAFVRENRSRTTEASSPPTLYERNA